MRNFHGQLHVLLLVIAALLVPDLAECTDRSIRERENYTKERRTESYQLSRMYSEHQGCVDDIYASDLNEDSKLSEDEYATFISKRSRGIVDVDAYNQLPFPLISTFVYGSCFCSFVLKIPNCCVGADAAIELDPNQSSYIESNLITVCRTVDDTLANLIGTFAPTSPPTDKPSNSPTNLPSIEPSSTPSFTPSDLPSNVPSAVPSTLAPSHTPTIPPIAAPSSAPVPVIETSMPTPEDLICVDFQYGIENDDGFTSEDIENEVNNKFKEALLIATETVVTQVLENGRNLEKASLRADRSNHPRGLRIVNFDGFLLDGDRTLYSPNSQKNRINGRTDRRLAYYTDTYPPVINNIFDNPYCPNSGVICSVVDTTVCVMLDEGDEKDEVKEALLDGIEGSFRDGSFQSAVPTGA